MVWRHPYFARRPSNKEPMASGITCYECGWMFKDHRDPHSFNPYTDGGVLDVYYCPSAPQLPGHPKDDNGSTYYDPYLKIKELEACLRVASLDCVPNHCIHTSEQKGNSGSYFYNDNGIGGSDFFYGYSMPYQQLLIDRLNDKDLKIKNLQNILRDYENRPEVPLLKKEIKLWQTKHWEKEKEILEVRSQLERKEKELKDTLASKTISVHNYYKCNTEWQPIETAPKDGASILIWRPCVGNEFMVTAYFRGKELSQLTGWMSVESGTFVVDPQYWMPLPHSPYSKAKED